MRYKSLNYGTKSARDHIQIELQKCLAGIPMQINISDDILIGGHRDEEHDETLEDASEIARKGTDGEGYEVHIRRPGGYIRRVGI